MEDKNFTEKASLELISQMITSSRRKLEDGNGIRFLIWGYTTFFVSLLVYYFIYTTSDYHYHFLWFLIPVIGSVGMFISKRNQAKQFGHAMNFIERVIGNIWLVIGIAAFMCSISAFLVRIPVLPLMLLLMGIGTTLTGLTIKFKPVIISGIIGMASCVVPFVMKGNEQILVFGFIYLIMMVIPGHIINFKGRTKHV